MAERQNTIKAITFLMLGLLCFDVMMLQVRYLLTNFSALEYSAYRNVFGIIPSLIVMLYTEELRLRKKTLALRQWKLAFVRGAIVAGVQLTFYSAIGFMELATIAALGHTSDFLQCSCPFFFSAKA